MGTSTSWSITSRRLPAGDAADATTAEGVAAAGTEAGDATSAAAEAVDADPAAVDRAQVAAVPRAVAAVPPAVAAVPVLAAVVANAARERGATTSRRAGTFRTPVSVGHFNGRL